MINLNTDTCKRWEILAVNCCWLVGIEKKRVERKFVRDSLKEMQLTRSNQSICLTILRSSQMALYLRHVLRECMWN